MQRILFVAQTYHPKIGGAERYIDRLAQVMAKRGHEVFVLAPLSDAHELKRDYTVIRTNFYDRYKGGILYYLRALPMARKIVKLIRENNIDVVHFQYINPFTVPIRYLQSANAKIFATIHGSGVHFMQEDWLGKRLLGRVLRAIDGVCPVSDYCGKLAIKWGAEKKRIHVIYNGTDPEIFTPASDAEDIDHNSILSACRLVPRKDITTLIKAVKVVRKNNKNVKLLIAGDGPDRPRLEVEVKKAGLKNAVKFCGFVSDKELQALYKRAGIFVLPAKYDAAGRDIEGFGISLVEAMSSGRPVIGANVGGIPSAIKKEWGYLYEPEDWKGLAEKVEYLMDNPEIATAKGKEGRSAVETVYNWKNIAKKIEQMYASEF